MNQEARGIYSGSVYIVFKNSTVWVRLMGRKLLPNFRIMGYFCVIFQEIAKGSIVSEGGGSMPNLYRISLNCTSLFVSVCLCVSVYVCSQSYHCLRGSKSNIHGNII